MKKWFCLVLALVLALSCVVAYADTVRVDILSRFTMEVPTAKGYAVTTNEGYSKVFPFYSDDDIDSVMKVYFVEEELDAFRGLLTAEEHMLDTFTELGKFPYAQKVKNAEKRGYRTICGIEQCLYNEADVTVKDLMSEANYMVICVLVPKDGGTYIIDIQSKSEEKAQQMVDLLETIEWK